jgi:DNA polymerase III alpha subunit
MNDLETAGSKMTSPDDANGADDAIHLIKETENTEPRCTELPMDDPKTYEIFASANGIFQFESSGMKAFCALAESWKISRH